MNITGKTKFKEVFQYDNLMPARKYVMYSHKWWSKTILYMTADGMSRFSPSHCGDGLLFGMKRLVQIGQSGKQFLYAVGEREDVVLMHFPGEDGAGFVVICPGGGYLVVSNVNEGFPVAARFNQEGLHAFVLNYTLDSKTGALPNAIEDLALAVEFIQKNAQALHVDPKHYMVAGFSAGGHLIMDYCLQDIGYPQYGISKPDAAFIIYPGVYHMLENEQGIQKEFVGMLGKNYTRQKYEKYCNLNHVESFPPVFTICNEDDSCCPGTKALEALLKSRNIPCRSEFYPTGGHGCGDGSGLEAAGWVHRGVMWLERRTTENNLYASLTEAELLDKLAASRNHASEGKLRDAEDVVADMRTKYE